LVQFDAVERSSRRFTPGPCSRSAPPRSVNVERATDCPSAISLSALRQRGRSRM